MGLEYLYQKRWMRKLCLHYKYLSIKQPSHNYSLLPQMRNSHRHPNTFNVFASQTEYSKNSFFPLVINEWNELDPNIRTSSSYNIFRNVLLIFIRPVEWKVFNIIDSLGIKILTRVRLGFSHLRKPKLRNDFKDTLNPLCIL